MNRQADSTGRRPASTDRCDHTSVGMLVWRANKLLLIERRKFPFGFAPPAGHVDDRGSFEKAADAELFEEVGLHAKKRTLVAEGRKDNPCRRAGGDWHYWKIYQVDVSSEKLNLSIGEVKQAKWLSRSELKKLAERTEAYCAGEVGDTAWEEHPGLEQVWCEWLKQLGIV